MNLKKKIGWFILFILSLFTIVGPFLILGYFLGVAHERKNTSLEIEPFIKADTETESDGVVEVR